MRYFARSGPDTLLQDGPMLQRFVRGPRPGLPELRDGEGRLVRPAIDGTPGERIAYDDSDPDQAARARDKATEPGWYEVTAEGKALAAIEAEAIASSMGSRFADWSKPAEVAPEPPAEPPEITEQPDDTPAEAG